MGEIKSALQIALERAEKIGKASKDELEKEEWIRQGKQIASKYLNKEIESLREELSNVPPASIQEAISGAMDTLIRNIALPRDRYQWETINRAAQGIVELKGSIAMQVTQKIKELLTVYEQSIDQYKEQVRMQFQAKLGGLQQAIMQQYGAEAAANIDFESLPEFQQEMMKVRGEIDSQFNHQLQQLKDYLMQI